MLNSKHSRYYFHPKTIIYAELLLHGLAPSLLLVKVW